MGASSNPTFGLASGPSNSESFLPAAAGPREAVATRGSEDELAELEEAETEASEEEAEDGGLKALISTRFLPLRGLGSRVGRCSQGNDPC